MKVGSYLNFYKHPHTNYREPRAAHTKPMTYDIQLLKHGMETEPLDWNFSVNSY